MTYIVFLLLCVSLVFLFGTGSIKSASAVRLIVLSNLYLTLYALRSGLSKQVIAVRWRPSQLDSRKERAKNNFEVYFLFLYLRFFYGTIFFHIRPSRHVFLFLFLFCCSRACSWVYINRLNQQK